MLNICLHLIRLDYDVKWCEVLRSRTSEHYLCSDPLPLPLFCPPSLSITKSLLSCVYSWQHGTEQLNFNIASAWYYLFWVFSIGPVHFFKFCQDIVSYWISAPGHFVQINKSSEKVLHCILILMILLFLFFLLEFMPYKRTVKFPPFVFSSKVSLCSLFAPPPTPTVVGVLRMQKLKLHLLRTQGSKVLPLYVVCPRKISKSQNMCHCLAPI